MEFVSTKIQLISHQLSRNETIRGFSPSQIQIYRRDPYLHENFSKRANTEDEEWLLMTGLGITLFCVVILTVFTITCCIKLYQDESDDEIDDEEEILDGSHGTNDEIMVIENNQQNEDFIMQPIFYWNRNTANWFGGTDGYNGSSCGIDESCV